MDLIHAQDHGGTIQWPESLDAPPGTMKMLVLGWQGKFMKMEEMGMKPAKHQCNIYLYIYIYIYQHNIYIYTEIRMVGVRR